MQQLVLKIVKSIEYCPYCVVPTAATESDGWADAALFVLLHPLTQG